MMDVSPEERCLEERSELAGYVVIIVLTLFGVMGATRSYDFLCQPKPRGGVLYWWWCTLAESEYSGRGRGEKGSWQKM